MMDTSAQVKDNLNTTRFFADTSQLQQLKSKTHRDSPEALREVSRQFEALFLQMILKNMREANNVLRSDLLNTNQTDFYDEMYHQQLAKTLSESEHLGLAKVLMNQMSTDKNKETPVATSDVSNDQASLAVRFLQHHNTLGKVEHAMQSTDGLPLKMAAPIPIKVDAAKIYALDGYQRPSFQAADNQQQAIKHNNTQRADLAPMNQMVNDKLHVIEAQRHLAKSLDTRIDSADAARSYQAASRKAKRFTSASEFAKVMLPYAQEIGQKIGIDPKVLVAQAALETGWGRSIIQGRDGTNSHNLFGIKAHRWRGDTVTVTTHEYRSGVRRKERAAFRSYDSYKESFNDYVSFLHRNPRYGRALQHVSDPVRFTRELQRAGYATDPAYSRKILKLYNSSAIQNADR